MALPPIVALDIGTSKVLALVAEVRDDDCILVTGMGEHSAVGVKKGEVTHLENAAICVKHAMQAAEESSDSLLQEVFLSVSGGHIQSVSNRGEVPVLDREDGVTSDDINKVSDVAKAVDLSHDREAIHDISQNYCVDGHEKVTSPIGLAGTKLVQDVLVIHGISNRIDNTVRVAEELHLDVNEIAFSGLCSALSVLTPEQKQGGVVVIDLGAGITDYLVYAGGVMASAGAIGVGGDHITNDIVRAFSIPQSQAEAIKIEAGSAILDTPGAAQRITLPPEGGFQGCQINMKSLHTVIHARCDELFRMIKQRLEDESLLLHVGAGVVLTGGCARLNGITELAGRIFGLPCSIGRPAGLSGLTAISEHPEYATACGLVKFGVKVLSEQDDSSKVSKIFRKLFGGS
ncbi:cell division protein FtsA [bacterium B17]|nr:cell division protein FtsA [bacterium B17]